MTNPTDRDELEPCPGCGGEARMMPSTRTGFIYCNADERGCGFEMRRSRPDEAIAAWNRRATPTPQAGDELARELATLVETGTCIPCDGEPYRTFEIDEPLRDRILTALTASGNDVLREAIMKVRDGYASQAKFADHEPAAYFREFVRRIDDALSTTPTMSAEEQLAEALAVIAYEAPADPSRVAHDALKMTARPLTKEPSQ